MEIIVIYIAVGAVAGFIGGLFGVGGGVVVVPALIWVFSSQGIAENLLTHMALGTSLAVMVVTSASSAWAHVQAKAVLVDVVVWMSAGVIAGSVLGVSLAVSLRGEILQLGLGCFLTYVGIQMFVGFKFSRDTSLPSRPALSLVGGIIGAVSMLFGIGGGSMTVPFLSWRGIATQRAVATSAVLGVPIALFGAALYAFKTPPVEAIPEYSLGYVYLPAFCGLAIASIPAAKIGARLTHKLPAIELRKAFGCFILLMATSLLLKNLLG